MADGLLGFGCSYCELSERRRDGPSVWYVRQTLEATRANVGDVAKTAAAAVEANRIMREDRRPWVDMDLFGIDKIDWQPGFGFFLNVRFENIGKQIATDGLCLVELYGPDSSMFPKVLPNLLDRYSKRSRPGIKLLPSKPMVLQTLGTVPKAFFNEDGTIAGGNTSASMCIFFGYRDSTGGHYYTTKVYWLQRQVGTRVGDLFNPRLIKQSELSMMPVSIFTTYS